MAKMCWQAPKEAAVMAMAETVVMAEVGAAAMAVAMALAGAMAVGEMAMHYEWSKPMSELYKPKKRIIVICIQNRK
jgi:hypothetical protein